MSRLLVEYSKSNRARCANNKCSQLFVKHELRIGTEVRIPNPASEDGYNLSFKWRHLGCLTKTQLKNAQERGDLDRIEGYDDLAPADKLLVDQMKRGELVEAGPKGVAGNVAESSLAHKLLGGNGTKKATALKAKSSKKAPREKAKKE